MRFISFTRALRDQDNARNRFRWLQLSLVLTLIVLPPPSLPESAISAQIPANSTAEDGYIGNQACASCHSAIYESYSQTPMAHASGPATEDFVPADFVHPQSGVHYRIFAERGTVWLSFERSSSGLIGTRQLLYSIGSGRRGRTYLFAVEGFFFESPVNWYADRRQWDMAPAYGAARQVPLNLPAYRECLRCHTSGLQQPVKGTDNKYEMPLFTQEGIGCEQCHGPGAAHVKGGAIINPSKLGPTQRDSICMQCHLEANVAIERAGRHVYDFRPGDVLDDYVRHYIVSSNPGSGLGANSQFEALAESKCKSKFGKMMSCVNCHDPHFVPAESQRAAYYRGKCLGCHGADFARKHQPNHPDCVSCHMPRALSTDIAHTEVTDHRVRRRPQIAPTLLQEFNSATPPLRLTPFPYSKEAVNDLRDEALAWESLAEGGVAEATGEAERFLPLAAKQAPLDPPVLVGLAFLELKRGHTRHAEELYRRALSLNPDMIDAAANLGVIDAGEGDFRGAIRLWESVVQRAPDKSPVGMNLARTYCEAAEPDRAREVVERVLRFNPDLSKARELLERLDSKLPKYGR